MHDRLDRGLAPQRERERGGARARARAPRGARRSAPAPRPSPRRAPCCGWWDRRPRPNATPSARRRTRAAARASARSSISTPRPGPSGRCSSPVAQLALAGGDRVREQELGREAVGEPGVGRLAVDRLRGVGRGGDPDRPVEGAGQVDGELAGDRRRRADAADLGELHGRELAGPRRTARRASSADRRRSRRPRSGSRVAAATAAMSLEARGRLLGELDARAAPSAQDRSIAPRRRPGAVGVDPDPRLGAERPPAPPRPARRRPPTPSLSLKVSKPALRPARARSPRPRRARPPTSVALQRTGAPPPRRAAATAARP